MPLTEKALHSARNPEGARISINDKTKLPMDVWKDIQALNPAANERTGYPTQKPPALNERIIKASTGGIVLDSIAGCATTCLASEHLKRQWVGVDLWDKVKDVLLDHMKKESMIADGSMKAGDQTLLFPKDIAFTKELQNAQMTHKRQSRTFRSKSGSKSRTARVGRVKRCMTTC